MQGPIILMIGANLRLNNCFLTLLLPFTFIAPSSLFWVRTLPLGTQTKLLSFSFFYAKFPQILLLPHWKPCEFLGFVSVWTTTILFLILGISTFFCLGSTFKMFTCRKTMKNSLLVSTIHLYQTISQQIGIIFLEHVQPHDYSASLIENSIVPCLVLLTIL